MASAKDKLIAEALKLVEKGQYERAVKVYLKVVAEDENDVRAWLAIGDLYSKLRKNHDAAETYQRVAQFYSDQGFYRKAIAVYKQIIRLDPAMVSVYERLAELYKQMGLLPDAIEQYQAVATQYQTRGDIRAALAAMKQMAELDPHNVASRVKLAEMYSKEHMIREAIDEFAKAAEFLHEQGRFDDYMKVAERLLFHAPDNRPVSRELARLYLRKGDARRALPRLQVCFKADPRDTDTLTLLADAFEALGQKAKAVPVLKELARIHADNGAFGDRDAAWRRILSLEPTDAETLAAMASAVSAARASSGPMRPTGVPAVSARMPPAGAPREPLTTAMQSTLTRRRTAEMRAMSMAEVQAPAPVAAPPPAPAPAALSPSPVPLPTRGPATVNRPVEPAPAVAAPAESEPPDEAEVQKVLSEADVFMKYSLQAKAIEHVRGLVERAPRHADARRKLKSIYLALGRTDEAIEEMHAIAQEYAGAPEEADFLREILEIDPAHPWAGDRLREAERRASAPPAAFSVAAPAAQMAAEEDIDVAVELDDIEELPDHEIEIDDIQVTEDVDAATSDAADEALARAELEAELAASTHRDAEFDVVVDSPAATASAGAEEIEDRFGADLDGPPAAPSEPEESFAGLNEDKLQDPSLTTGEHTLAAAGLPAEVDVENFDFSSFDDPAPARPAPVDDGFGADLLVGRGTTDVGPYPPPMMTAESSGLAFLAGASPAFATVAPTPPQAVATSIEDDLEETDFLVQQGLYDEARAAVQALLRKSPQHPLLLSKIAEIDALLIAGAADEIALPIEEEPPPRVEKTVSRGTPRGTVVEVGVSEDDFESHFDLGIAYKEMGLLDNAIAEFKIVMRDPTREVIAHQMMGLLLREKGQISDAISQFKQGLYADGIQEDEELSLFYELGSAYQHLGDSAEALYYFERIVKRQPRYRDVPERIAQLSSGGSREAFGASAGNRK